MMDSESKVDGNSPQMIRITDHGKMKAWISFALNFLEANENKPICLHTLPFQANSASQSTPTSESSVQKQTVTASMSTATTTVPRLISVVEIVKREYVKSLALKHSTRLAGLHQYNEIGCLEDVGLGDPAEGPESSRPAMIARALDGKNHPKQKKTPFMKITLSLCALPELVERGATYQPPAIRQLSKSAKSRQRRRARKAKEKETETERQPADVDSQMLSVS